MSRHLVRHVETRAVTWLPTELWKALKVKARGRHMTARLAVIEALYDWLGTPTNSRPGLPRVQGRVGGLARAARLTKERRSEIARTAAIAGHKTRKSNYYQKTGLKPWREDEF